MVNLHDGAGNVIGTVETHQTERPIQEMLKTFFENDSNRISEVGISVLDFKNITKIINNTKEDFIILRGISGLNFIFNTIHNGVVISISDIINSEEFKTFFSNNAIAYQIGGKQVILKSI